jgi:hypothetical protein
MFCFLYFSEPLHYLAKSYTQYIHCVHKEIKNALIKHSFCVSCLACFSHNQKKLNISSFLCPPIPTNIDTTNEAEG